MTAAMNEVAELRVLAVELLDRQRRQDEFTLEDLERLEEVLTRLVAAIQAAKAQREGP